MSGADRLVSLDALRGLTVIGMVVVNSAAHLHYGKEIRVWPALLHEPWAGLTLADLVFPAFLTMVGVSIPFAMRSAALDGPTLRSIGARTLRLMLLGLILSNLAWAADWSERVWRWPGVLQRIGLVYGACACLYLTLGSRARVALAAGLLLLYWPLVLLPSLDGAPTDIGARGLNFAASLDRIVFGEHIYVKGPAGYDPEGLLGTLPAIAQGLIGITIGELLRSGRARRGRALIAAGAAMAAAGAAWNLAFPVIKNIWSSSFVLVTAGATVVALGLLHALLDGDENRARWLKALALPFGVNAVAAYTLHQLTGPLPGWSILLATFQGSRALLGEAGAALVPIALYAALLWLPLRHLATRGWIIKV